MVTTTNLRRGRWTGSQVGTAGHPGQSFVEFHHRSATGTGFRLTWASRPGLRFYDHRMIHKRLKDEVPRAGIGQSRTVHLHLCKANWL